MGRILIAFAIAGALTGAVSTLAVAAPAMPAPTRGGSSPIIAAAVHCGPHARYIRGHRDSHGHYIRGRCVSTRHHEDNHH